MGTSHCWLPHPHPVSVSSLSFKDRLLVTSFRIPKLISVHIPLIIPSSWNRLKQNHGFLKAVESVNKNLGLRKLHHSEPGLLLPHAWKRDHPPFLAVKVTGLATERLTFSAWFQIPGQGISAGSAWVSVNPWFNPSGQDGDRVAEQTGTLYTMATGHPPKLSN